MRGRPQDYLSITVLTLRTQIEAGAPRVEMFTLAPPSDRRFRRSDEPLALADIL
jgi:hypothetical protein